MDWHGKSIRMGALVIATAVVLRLWSAGAFQTVSAALTSPTLGSFLVYLETGRVVHPTEPSGSAGPSEPTESTTPPETKPAETKPLELPCFSKNDVKKVHVWGTGKTVDPTDFLDVPLKMDLSGEKPTVLILSTHATESYTKVPGQSYKESSSYRTLDPDYNMLAIGTYLAQLLEAGGIRVVRDQGLHDYPEYTDAYTRSQAAAEEMLRAHPEVFLILDLHRDSLTDDDGRELDTSATVNGQDAAQLMFLMSTGHDGWKDNMNLAVKMTAWLEKTYPGVTRGIFTRTMNYNQQLSPGALLVEVGAAGNTQEEAMRAVQALAEAILALKYGAE